MLTRFGDTLPAEASSSDVSGFANQVVQSFRAYWRKALMQAEAREQLTARLESRLRTLLRLPAGSDTAQIEQALIARLAEEGLYALLGQTGVLRELMIWRQEDRLDMAVNLPYGSYQTRVALLDDFLVRGWGSYATCETRFAGGWVADRILYAVVPAYKDLDGEEFRVTFLGHETQHFVDLEAYPSLEPWELEYRAKLIELSMAEQTRVKVLNKFIEDQGDNPSSPHSFANRKVLRGLMARLSQPDVVALRSVNAADLQSAAFALYEIDTARRDRSSDLP